MNNAPELNNLLNDQQICEYLKKDPNFFERNSDLLIELKLAHPSGQAVSLIEKQVAVMRQRNTELRNKLNELLSNARENDRLFERTKRLVLAMIECNELGDLVDAINYSFDKEFAIPFTRIIIFSERNLDCNARFCSKEDVAPVLGHHLRSSRSCCGNLGPEEIAYLFDQDAKHVGSAAIAVFGLPSPTGIIAVGHPSKEHYRSGVGTLFLGHIAEVVGRLVAKLA